jgi:hypothetical protein
MANPNFNALAAELDRKTMVITPATDPKEHALLLVMRDLAKAGRILEDQMNAIEHETRLIQEKVQK